MLASDATVHRKRSFCKGNTHPNVVSAGHRCQIGADTSLFQLSMPEFRVLLRAQRYVIIPEQEPSKVKLSFHL